jgi:hypothetical protein
MSFLGTVAKYWYVFGFIGTVGSAVGVFVIQHKSYAHTIAVINAANQAAIDNVNNARVTEDAQHTQELNKLYAQLALVQSQWVADQTKLHAQQLHDQQQIIKKYGTDMPGLAKLLAQSYKFQVQ